VIQQANNKLPVFAVFCFGSLKRKWPLSNKATTFYQRVKVRIWHFDKSGWLLLPLPVDKNGFSLIIFYLPFYYKLNFLFFFYRNKLSTTIRKLLLECISEGI